MVGVQEWLYKRCVTLAYAWLCTVAAYKNPPM